jgi:uncharacterized protein (DUF2164 family)
MNRKQLEIISKEFNVVEDFSLTRSEFEGFPCPMVACLWTDEQMQELADRVKKEFDYTTPKTEEEWEELDDQWYRVIENCALRMGMQYYEDLSSDERKEINDKWEAIK